MKSFDIPFQFSSTHVKRIRDIRNSQDKRKQDLRPTLLQFDKTDVLLARHFGFCFGVQNAVERAYQILEENLNKNIYLLSEIIHNPEVNKDLQAKGMRFIQDTAGTQLIEWENISQEDIVIIPAFGTTIEIEDLLKAKQLKVERFDTTCPFVERVWNKGEQLGKDGATLIIHGNSNHEETRATFSKVAAHSKCVIVSNMNEARILRDFILQKGLDERDWNVYFRHQASKGFNFRQDLEKVAVINQTTMLASETQEIANYMKSVMEEKFGASNIQDHFGSTRDTLCYATNDNQTASAELAKHSPDIIFVVGGFNSSNTTHLVELLSKHCPTYFIRSDKDLLDEDTIRHFDLSNKTIVESSAYLEPNKKLKIGITSGASCPDALMERVLLKILSFADENADIVAAIDQLEQQTNGL